MQLTSQDHAMICGAYHFALLQFLSAVSMTMFFINSNYALLIMVGTRNNVSTHSLYGNLQTVPSFPSRSASLHLHTG